MALVEFAGKCSTVMMVRSIAIDWSGAKKPRRKLVLAEAQSGILHRLEFFDSRDLVIQAVADYGKLSENVVVGIDFAFSFPRWFIDHLGMTDTVTLWNVVRDQGERWLGDSSWPFWGRPHKRRPALEEHLRLTEKHVSTSLGFAPKSTFQIGGAGAVGTGSIRGMPFLSRCREAGFSVWPIEDATGRDVIEIYPRALTGPVVKKLPNARRDYMERSPWRLSPDDLRAVTDSEDAFDAAISALVMDEHASELGALPSGDATETLEGRIWVPNDSPHRRVR